MNNFELVTNINALKSFEEKKLPIKLSYAIAKNLMILDAEYNLYEKTLQKILSTYEPFYVKDKDGNVQTDGAGLPLVDKEHGQDFVNDLNELLSSQIEITIYTIDENILDFDDTKYDSLSAKEMMFLMNFLINKGG